MLSLFLSAEWFGYYFTQLLEPTDAFWYFYMAALILTLAVVDFFTFRFEPSQCAVFVD